MRNASVVKINYLVLSTSLSVNQLATSPMPRNAYTHALGRDRAPSRQPPRPILVHLRSDKTGAFFGHRLRHVTTDFFDFSAAICLVPRTEIVPWISLHLTRSWGRGRVSRYNRNEENEIAKQQIKANKKQRNMETVVHYEKIYSCKKRKTSMTLETNWKNDFEKRKFLPVIGLSISFMFFCDRYFPHRDNSKRWLGAPSCTEDRESIRTFRLHSDYVICIMKQQKVQIFSCLSQRLTRTCINFN